MHTYLHGLDWKWSMGSTGRFLQNVSNVKDILDVISIWKQILSHFPIDVIEHNWKCSSFVESVCNGYHTVDHTLTKASPNIIFFNGEKHDSYTSGEHLRSSPTLEFLTFCKEKFRSIRAWLRGFGSNSVISIDRTWSVYSAFMNVTNSIYLSFLFFPKTDFIRHIFTPSWTHSKLCQKNEKFFYRLNWKKSVQKLDSKPFGLLITWNKFG